MSPKLGDTKYFLMGYDHENKPIYVLHRLIDATPFVKVWVRVKE